MKPEIIALHDKNVRDPIGDKFRSLETGWQTLQTRKRAAELFLRGLTLTCLMPDSEHKETDTYLKTPGVLYQYDPSREPVELWLEQHYKYSTWGGINIEEGNPFEREFEVQLKGQFTDPEQDARVQSLYCFTNETAWRFASDAHTTHKELAVVDSVEFNYLHTVLAQMQKALTAEQNS